jgi:hypothetical protein
VSLLPIPQTETLPDGHRYTPLRNIMEYVLMMKKFHPGEWQSIASCKTFLKFMADVRNSMGSPKLRQLAVGLLVWTDGWDTSTGCKSNCLPMHTGTVTLLFVYIESKLVVGLSTLSHMGGPEKLIMDWCSNDSRRTFTNSKRMMPTEYSPPVTSLPTWRST